MPACLDPQQIMADPIEAHGILYFLPAGHFLWRWSEKGAWESKFVTIEDVAASLANVENDSGWLGEGVIRAGHSARGDWFVYTAPAQKIMLTLVSPEQSIAVTIPIPTTVLIGVGPAYYLYAAQETIVTPRSNLYHAPFPNVYGNGRICWGQNHRPAAHPSRAKAVWKLFFETPFNSHLASGKSLACAKNVTEQLRWLSNNHTRKYPLADLVRLNVTLDHQVQQVMDRNWRE